MGSVREPASKRRGGREGDTQPPWASTHRHTHLHAYAPSSCVLLLNKHQYGQAQTTHAYIFKKCGEQWVGKDAKQLAHAAGAKAEAVAGAEGRNPGSPAGYATARDVGLT